MKAILKPISDTLFNDISISKINRYTKKTSPLFLRNGLIVIIGLFQAYIFTHFVTQETYGSYLYVVSILAILAPFTLPGINTAIVRCATKKQEFIYYSLVKTRIKWSIFASIILIIYASYLYFHTNSGLSIVFAISAIFFPFYYTTQTYISLLNGRELFSSMMKYQLSYTIVAFLSITFGIFIGGNLIWIFLFLFVGSILFNFYALIKVKPDFNSTIMESNKRGGDIFKDSIKYGKHMTVIGVLPAIESRIDKILIGLFFGFADLAVFGIAKMFQEQLKNLWVVFSQILYPRSFKNNEDDDKIFLFKAFVLIFLCFLGIIFLLEIILPYLIPLLFTKKYSDSIFYSQLLVAGVLIGLPGAVFETFLRTHSKFKSLYMLRIATPLVYFVSLPLFIKYSGLIGIIWAMYIKNCVYSVLTVIFMFGGRK